MGMSEQKLDFSVVTEFENRIAKFFGAKYGIAVDSATHGIELCLRLAKAGHISCPRNTYLSVPMLANKLGITLLWKKEGLEWEDYYNVYSGNGFDIRDCAVLWKENSYKKGTMMCVSFQKQKHLSVGRLGVILLDNERQAIELKKMSYDGRELGPWRNQNVKTFGYHYYAQPELCALALNKLEDAINTKPKSWSIKDWPDLLETMDVFKK